jgi:hypothetical protein
MKEVMEDGELRKKPMINWAEFQKRLPTDEELLSWFTPPYNGIPKWNLRDSPLEPWGLAAVLQHNLFSVDLDTEEVYQYLKQGGAYPARACIFRTRKGYHVIMRSSTIVPYTVSEGQLTHINPLFEHLGIGGGDNHLSINPDTPDRVWIELYDDPVPVDYEGWLEKYLGWSKRSRGMGRLTDYVGIGKGEDWGAKFLGGEIEGSWDEACFKYACRLRNRGLTQEEAVAILELWGEKSTPMFPLKRVIEKVKSAYSEKYMEGEGRGEETDYGAPQGLQQYLSGLHLAPQVIGGLASRGELIMVFGVTGVGKSSFLEYIVACACAGANIADIFLVMQPLRALFIDTQMAPIEVGLRFETLFNKLGRGIENFSIKSYSDFDITKPEAQRWLYDTIKQGGYDIWAIDPFEDIHHLNENDTADMKRAVTPMRKVVNELSCVGLVGHHAGGDQYDNRGRLLPKKPRGATAITDRFDTVIELISTENEYEKLLHVRKQRKSLVPRQKDIILKYDPETLLMSLGGLPAVIRAYKEGAAERYRILEALLKVKSLGITDAEIAEQLGVARATVTRWISGIRKPDDEMQAKFSALLRWAEERE